MIEASVAERTSVEVDLRQVVAEGVAAHGFSDVIEQGGLLQLYHPAVSSATCSILFPVAKSIGSLELRARYQQPLLVRVYVGEPPPAQVALVENALGVVPVRLRDLAHVELETLTRAAAEAKIATSSFGITDADVALTSFVADADPRRVADYANNADAIRFESATAAILDGLLGTVLALGARLSGMPVPDGMLLHDWPDRRVDVALYDCKSRNNSATYRFPPGDGDQFARYLQILKRCEDANWRATGLLVATTDADSDVLDERMAKDIWSRLQGRRLLIAPAQILLKWHQLASGEGSGFRGRMNTAESWKALWELQLDGIAEHRLAYYFPKRDVGYRVLTPVDAELIWLAGALAVRASVASAFAQLQCGSVADPIDRHKRPMVANQVLKFLGEKPGISIDDLVKEVRLSRPAIEFIIEGKAFETVRTDELGEHFVANWKRLRAALTSP